MCSELFRIPIQWHGVPLFGFGVLMGLWVTVGVVLMVRTARRSGWTAEVWSQVPALVLGAAAFGFLPRVFPDGMPIRGFGSLVLCGAVLAIGLAVVRARRAGLDPEVILSLAFWLFLSGIAGARAFYVIEYWDTRFRSDSWTETVLAVLNFPEGGLVVFGSVIGGAVGFVLFCRLRRLPTLAVGDLIAPSLMAGLALGRIGCLMNGCCYGGVCDLPWAVTFPPESVLYGEQAQSGQLYGFRLTGPLEDDGPLIVAMVVPESPAAEAGLTAGQPITGINGYQVPTLAHAKLEIYSAFSRQVPLEIHTADGQSLRLPVVPPPARSLPVQPTQIYSAIHAGLLAWFLWSWYPMRRRDGEVTALLATIYPVGRFLLEIIRIDESAVFGTGLSISQNISLVVLVVAAGLWYFLRHQPIGNLAFAEGNHNDPTDTK